MQQPTLLLDFDGTVCLGDDPVSAYADAVAESLDAVAATALRSELAHFLERGTGAFPDGYAAVHALSAGRVDNAAMATAYLQSRERLAQGDLDVWAPRGLTQFLDGISARVVLATNAPERGVVETLDRLELTGRIDEVITDAGKPDGMSDIVDRLLGNSPPYLLASVGDIWRNDLDAPHRRGCVTAYIDRHGYHHDGASFAASTFEELYPALLEWSSDSATFALTHEGRS